MKFENIAIWNGKNWRDVIGRVSEYFRDDRGKSIGYLLELRDGSEVKVKYSNIVFLNRPRGYHPIRVRKEEKL